jgi:hypothetical protein
MRDLNNIIEYSVGFLDGAQKGKPELTRRLGAVTVETLKQYIDSNARANPMSLHHVYEWYQTGSPEARLFDIEYTVTGMGLSINSTFRQSQVIKAGSNTPFYNKATMMENGVSVTIRPKRSDYLAFDTPEKTVFTKNPITVSNPGGSEVVGSYERTFESFFNNYFSQAFLGKSGLLSFLSDTSAFKDNMRKGKRAGRAAGISTGYNWIINLDEVA